MLNVQTWMTVAALLKRLRSAAWYFLLCTDTASVCVCVRYSEFPTAIESPAPPCLQWQHNSLTISVLTAIFPGEPGLASFIGAKDHEVVVTTGAIRRAKLQSNHHHQQTNTQLFTGRMPFLSPNQQRQSTEGKTAQLTAKWNITDVTWESQDINRRIIVFRSFNDMHSHHYEGLDCPTRV